MSIIDSTVHSFTCSVCHKNEICKIKDIGNNYSGSFWQEPAELELFEVAWKRDKAGEPQVVRVVCKTCHSVAIHEVKSSL